MVAKKENGAGPSKREDVQYAHVFRKVADLIPYIKNARVHSDAQVSQLASAIREFGFTNPCLIDENSNIIAGHGRILAAKKLKMVEVPCIVIAGLSETQRKALVIADNQLATKSSWDNDMLLMELGDLSEDGFDLNIVGFSAQEMNAMLGLDEPKGPSEDDAKGDAYKEQYAIMVLCQSESEQNRVYDDLKTQGYSVKVVTT